MYGVPMEDDVVFSLWSWSWINNGDGEFVSTKGAGHAGDGLAPISELVGCSDVVGCASGTSVGEGLASSA